MFGTIRYKSRGGTRDLSGTEQCSVLFQSAHATGGTFPLHSACEACKTKKLRCDGRKPECQRCQTSGVECIYPHSSTDRRRRSRPPSIPILDARDGGGEISGTSQSISSSVLYSPRAGPDVAQLASQHLGIDETTSQDINVPGFENELALEQGITWPLFPLSRDFSNHDAHLRIDGEINNDGATELYMDPSATNISRTSASPTLSIIPDRSAEYGQFHHRKSPEGCSPQSTACFCLQTLASLLEDISTRIAKIGRLSFDSMLEYLKGTTGRCAEIACCPSCIIRSDRCMLLAVIMERLVSLIEATDVMGTKMVANELPSFGTYTLSQDEQTLVRRTLLAYRIKLVLDLVGRLNSSVVAAIQDAQSSVLRDIERRLMKLSTNLAAR